MADGGELVNPHAHGAVPFMPVGATLDGMAPPAIRCAEHRRRPSRLPRLRRWRTLVDLDGIVQPIPRLLRCARRVRELEA
ncbi:hypothetical protein Arub01_28180 [Actinomadura rubrobrunea]|uniref:Uncharacterized protein n=1 Tax=Actinomadura rubrobrunea TaxID=115335 RepID=A0A9W6PU67_9ACTN|nr:hypothetical protein Arub01_28180 [Actinomadura rubrobrunea]